MSDKEEDSDNVAGEQDDHDEEPSTSWGGGKRSGLKRKLMVESDEEEHRMAGSGDEDSDDEDATGDMLEDEAESGDSDSSGTPGAETCAICLGKMRGSVGSPAACEHTFCLDCILEWAKNNPTCPQDRIAFDKVLVRKSLGGPIDREIPVSKEKEEELVIPEETPTYCEVCNCCDREDRLLLCDGCDLGYHLECLDPPLTHVPIEEWFCPTCVEAGLASVVANRQQNTSEVRVERQRSGRNRSQSSSRQPRLIPRTGATERIRARIQHNRNKKKLKRKRRKERKRARIESGELEDRRPAVKTLTRFSAFVEGDNDIDAEFADDEQADMLLYGFGHQSAKRPEERKANAARLLRDAAFTPQPFYSGRSSSSIMSRIRDQPETQEDDILSGILENQSIVFSSSRNLTLNSERKLTKQSGEEDNTFILKEESLLPEPLPSRRASSPRPDIDKPSGSTDERSFSSFRSSHRHRPHSPPSRRRSCSPYRSHRTRSPLRRPNEGSRPLDEHRSPLDSRRRTPPQISYQRQLPRQNTWERRHNGSSSRKDYNGRKDRWSEAQEDKRYQRQNSPHQRKSDRERNSKEESNSSQGDFKSHGNRENQHSVSHNQGRSSQDPDCVPSRESHLKRDDSPDRRRSRYSHRDHSPHKRNRSWEKDSHFHRRKYSPSKRSWSRDERDRGPVPHRSFASDRRRSRSRSRSRERESRHPSLESKDRKSRSQWSYSYFNDVSGGVPSSDYSVHSLHGSKKSPSSNGKEKDSGATSSCDAVTANIEVASRSSNTDSKMETNLEFENNTINNASEEAKLPSECLTQDIKKIDKMPYDKEKNIEKKREDTLIKSYKNSSANIKKSESCDISNDYSSEKTMKLDMTDKEEDKGKRHKNIKDDSIVHHDGEDGAEHSKKKKAKLINSLFGEDDSERQHRASSPMNTDKIPQKGDNKDKDKKSSKSKNKKQSADADITNKNLFGEDSEEDTEIPHHGMQASKDILQSKIKKDVKVSKQNSSTNKNANVKNGMKETEVCNGNNGRHLKGFDLFGECDHEESLKKQDKQKSEGFIIKKKSNDTGTGQNDKEKELKERFMAGLAKGLFGKSAPIDESDELHGFYAPLDSKKVEKSLASNEVKGMFKVIEKNVPLEKQETELYKHGSSDHKPSTKDSEPSKFKKDDKHVKKSSVKDAPKHLKKDPKLVSSLFGSISDMDSSSDMEVMHPSSKEAIVDRIVKHFGKSTPENANLKHEREKTHHKHSKHLDDGSAKRDQRKEKDTGKAKQEDSRKHKAQERETPNKDEKMEGSKTTTSSGTVSSVFASNRKENDVKLEKIEGSKFATPSSQQASSSNTSKKENDSRIKQQKAALEVKVVKEVKKFLDPYYRDKTVSKDEYKEIVAKCVNKVVSAECGDIIETEKMRSLVEGYVKFYKHRKTKMQQVSS